ncbi:hypothetical protein NC652_028487 [Populus alba x Populus x berolinensis]|nr:hypothetical protein NC652_028487 [Populus alba x Populus x berolinensis]
MPIGVACEDHSATSVSMDNTSGSKRTKTILTKQQLPQLLIEKMSAAETCRLNSSSRWQTGLLRPSLKKSSILFSFKEINYKYMSSSGVGGWKVKSIFFSGADQNYGNEEKHKAEFITLICL